MKSKHICTLILLGFLFVFSNTLRAQTTPTPPSTPVEMNNYYAGIIADMYAKGTAWGEKYGLILNSKEFSQLKPLDKDMLDYIKMKSAELKTMKDIGGSKDFNDAMISFMEFEKQLVESAFLPFEKLSPSSSPDEISAANTNLSELAKEEDAKLDKIRVVQAAYAKKNNFDIEK